MKLCKFQNAAVCTDPKYRNFFKRIFQQRSPDVYICPQVMYKVQGHLKGGVFYINDIKFLYNDDLPIYCVDDPFTGKLILLNKNNFKAVCPCTQCIINKEPYVQTYESCTKKGN